MSRHQVGLLIGAGICILALISWVGEIDLGLGQLLDQPTPPAAPAPAGSNQPRPRHRYQPNRTNQLPAYRQKIAYLQFLELGSPALH